MAGFILGMDFRSPQQKEQDEKNYAMWAFPFGDAQQAAVTALLTALFEAKSSNNLYWFLQAKEAYWGTRIPGMPCAADEAAAAAALRRELPTKLRREIPLWLALLHADAAAESATDYPTAAAIRAALPAL